MATSRNTRLNPEPFIVPAVGADIHGKEKNKPMKKILLIVLISTTLGPFQGRAQVDHRYLLNKYWHYRERLGYFVQAGTSGSGRGESMVASVRNKHSTDVIAWEDQMIHFGSYLGVLATEYALLTFYGQDASMPQQELNIALNSYERDDRCENRTPWFMDNAIYDGFHMREDVPADFLTNHPPMNSGLTPANQVWNSDPGSPSWVARVCSNDYERWDVNPGFSPYVTYQTIVQMKEGAMDVRNSVGLLRGLVLVLKCLPVGSYAHAKAGEILGKVIQRMWSNGSWILLDPEMNAVAGGANAYSYTIPLSVIQLAAGQDALPPGPGTANANTAWQSLQYTGAGPNQNPGTLSLAALCDCWNGGLSGIPGLNTTQAGLFSISAPEQWDTFYLLLWAFLHDKSSEFLDMNKVLGQLDAAPCNGPWCYDSLGHQHAPDGWASVSKFDHALVHQEHGQRSQQGNYNGLDYMLLYNLFHLINVRDNIQPIAFMDMLNRNLSGILPECVYYPFDQLQVTFGDSTRHADYDAFKTISSSQIIDTVLHPRNQGPVGPNTPCPSIGAYDPGHVIYRAGECIKLKTGFHARPGVYFHAFIDPFDCSAYQSSGDPYGFTNTSNEYDLRGPLGNPWVVGGIPEYDLTAAALPLDTHDRSGLTLRLSPNPCSEDPQLWLHLERDGMATCMLYDLRGTLLWQTERPLSSGQSETISVPVSDLRPGPYYLNVSDGRQVQRLSLIRQ